MWAYSNMRHIPVLLQETIDGLALKNGDIFVDGTLGSAGHSEEVCRRFGTQVTIIGIDTDEDALERSEKYLQQKACRFSLHHANFSEIKKVLEAEGREEANGILLDLGLSSHQLEESGRGFTFQKDEPLLMTMRKNISPEQTTASDIVNLWKEENIADVIYAYGEERYSRRIAKAIVEARKKGEIKTTNELVEIIRGAVPGFYRNSKVNPATKTFQALRIVANDEMGNLERGLADAFEVLAKGGRLAVITFHSLEDRMVKRFFRDQADKGNGRLVTKKPIGPTETETKSNPRSRSAKVRIIEKI